MSENTVATMSPATEVSHGHDDHGSGHHSHGEQEQGGATGGLRFEPSEYDFFTAEDREAGVGIFKLLVGVFFISVILMGGVITWMLGKDTLGKNDPHEGVGINAEHGSHGDDDH